MKTCQGTAPVFGTLLFAIAMSGAAPAEEGEPYMTMEFDQLEIPSIRVTSTDGVKYNNIAGNTYAFMMLMSGDCLADRHVVLALAKPDYAPHPAEEVDISDLLPPAQVLTPRIVYVPDTVAPIAWHNSWRKNVIDACNANLEQKMSSGSPRGLVLSKDWNLGSTYVGAGDAELYCSVPVNAASHEDDGSWGHAGGGSLHVNLTCGRHLVDDIAPNPPRPPPDDLTYGVHVVESHLTVTPVATATQCGITLSGMVRTDFPNVWVSFQYKNNKGGMTPLRLVKTDWTKTAHFDDFMEFDPVAGGGFVATPQGAPGPGSFTIPVSDDQFSGTYQMDGSSPSFESNIAGFAFDCPPGSFTTLQAVPAPPGRP